MSRADNMHNFLKHTDFAGGELAPLAGDASFRRYIRIYKNNKTAMLMDAPPDKEDVRPFMQIAHYLYDKNYSAPKILASDEEHGFLLLEDIGDTTFTSLLKKYEGKELEGFSHKFYMMAIDVLLAWHDPRSNFVQTELLPLPKYDEPLLLKEIQLFSDWYLPQIVGIKKSTEISSEYIAIWREILDKADLATNQFVHRDYHADNLMWLPDRVGKQKVGLLDFQDAVYGDVAYDLVSLLEDARRDVSPELAEEMLSYYLSKSDISRDKFMASYALLGAQRNCKIIGIFSRLAARDKKENYLAYLPRVWKHLENDLKHPILAPLKQFIDMHISDEGRGDIVILYDALALEKTYE